MSEQKHHTFVDNDLKERISYTRFEISKLISVNNQYNQFIDS